MKFLTFAFALLALPLLSNATSLKDLKPLPSTAQHSNKIDQQLEALIAKAEASHLDLNTGTCAAILKIDGRYSKSELQARFGKKVLIRAAFPSEGATIATFEASLQTILDMANVNEVISIQGARVVAVPLPAFTGVN